MVLRKQRKYVVGMEPVKIIDKGCRLCKPLAVKLAPKRLAPAGGGNCEVESVGMNVMPILRRDVMTESVFIVVAGDFRILRYNLEWIELKVYGMFL